MSDDAKMTRKYNLNNDIVVIPNLENKKENENNQQQPADFETAITATGFGKYNILLILIAIPAGCSSVFETTTMSYVFPAAQCDLSLSLNDKGLLNATTYFGMISSAVIWGFLFDTLGRKKLLMIGFFMDATFVFLSTFSQSPTLLMVTKYMGGFIINGPFAALTSYISEFHAAKYRARMQLMLGTIFSGGSVILPLLAWLILPQDMNFSIFNGGLNFHSWNFYLLISGLPSFSSAIIFIFLPESPKFLMTMGRNDKALEIFQQVYSVNTGKLKETYPIRELIDEMQLQSQITANRTKIQALKEGWQQMKPIFFRPHLRNLILVCTMQLMFTMSLNTLRLWIPQIFQAINDYQFYNNASSVNLCDALEMIQPKNESSECIVNLNNSSVYVNSIIVSSITMSSYGLAAYFINKIGKKRLLSIFGLLSGIVGISMYFSANTATTLMLFSIFNASGSNAVNVVLAVIVDLFPTTLRTMTVSLSLMFARAGAMVGNIIFPMLLRIGCGPPFFLIGSVIIGCSVLSWLLPNTDLKALE